jgi:type III restriction enzyme
MNSDNPILNSPYMEPLLHYATVATGPEKGALDYTKIVKGRRIFNPESEGAIPTRQNNPQGQIFDINDFAEEYGTHIINLCRKEVGQWRAAKYPSTTRISKELLTFWFDNPERHAVKKLFFAQQEAIETAVWLNEVAEKSNAGQHILNLLRNGQLTVSDDQADQLPRIAFKMATGSGKTVFDLLPLLQQARVQKRYTFCRLLYDCCSGHYHQKQIGSFVRGHQKQKSERH